LRLVASCGAGGVEVGGADGKGGGLEEVVVALGGVDVEARGLEVADDRTVHERACAEAANAAARVGPPPRQLPTDIPDEAGLAALGAPDRQRQAEQQVSWSDSRQLP